MADGVPGGLWLDESVEVARLLEADGALDALELTGGSSFENPMYLFRGEAPIAEMAATFPQPLRTGFKLFGKRFFREYPFEEAYFLPYARQFRDALDMPLILLGGINRLDTIEQALDDGFEFVQMGRALLREPDLVARWQKGDDHESRCASTATSACRRSTGHPLRARRPDDDRPGSSGRRLSGSRSPPASSRS